MQISIRRGEPYTAYFLSQMLRDPIVNQFSSPVARDSDFSTSINQENRNILLSAGLHRIIEFFNGDVRSDDTRGHFSFFFFSPPSLITRYIIPRSSILSLRNCLIAANFFSPISFWRKHVYVVCHCINIFDILVRDTIERIELGFV